MPFIGNQPTAVPLTSADLGDGIVTSAKIADGTIASADLASGVGGKVLQVVSATDSTERSTSSATFVTGSNTLSVSITPSSTSSKIFILITGCGYNDTDNKYFNSTIYRDATNLGTSNGMYTHYDSFGVSLNFSMSYLDSPSSTSALTYQMYFKASATSNSYINNNGTTSSITAFEVSA